MSTSQKTPPTIVLVPGHWLGAWAWDEVSAHLRSRGREVLAVDLPGTVDGPERAATTPRDQADALAELVTAEAARRGPVVLVGHSGANAPVTQVLDRHPQPVRHVVWVDSGPLADGSVFMPGFPADQDELSLPPFAELGEQASLDGLDDDALERFRARAVPVPGPVLREAVSLRHDARRGIPATLICSSLSSRTARSLAAAGHPMFAEVATLHEVTMVDLPTGHWPMWSRPEHLADLLDATAQPA